MSSANYALSANSNGSSPVYFDLDPNPIPQAVFPRTGTVESTLGAADGSGNLYSGVDWTFDMGSSLSKGKLHLHIPKMIQATIASIQALYNTRNPVYYTNNNWTNIWEMAWDPTVGLAFDPKIVQGSNICVADLYLKYVKQVL